MIPPVTPTPAPGPAATAPQAGPDVARPNGTAPAAPPMLGLAAVTALGAGRSPRLDPLEPPADPAPLKGLGIPPLNTRQVGDFDKLDDTPPPPPPGGGYATLPRMMEASVDLRR